MRLFFKTKSFLWKNQLLVLWRDYRKLKFALLDLALGCAYLFSNPFRICRIFLQTKGEEEIHAYGETPLGVWRDITRAAKVGKEDVFFDLGCGRGRVCFWTALWIGCKTVGVDWVPAFMKRASLLAKCFGLENLEFIQGSLLDADLEKATVLYLYTFHPEEERLDFSRLQEGARVITVSEPIPLIKVVSKLSARFPWGETEVFIHRFSQRG